MPPRLRRMTVIILEHPSEPFTAFDVSDILADLLSGLDDLVVQTLMISFLVKMKKELADCVSQHVLTEEDHSGEALGFQGSEESFQMCVQVRRTRWQAQTFHAFAFERAAKRFAELRIAIHDQVAFTVKKTIFRIGQVSGNDFHPGLIWIRCASGQVNAARLQLHDEQQVIGDQPASGPDFDGGKVDRRQYVPVRFEERGPGGLALSVRSWLDTVRFENIAHGRVADVVAEVGQPALDAVVTPTGILLSEPQDQVDQRRISVCRCGPTSWPPIPDASEGSYRA